MLAQERRPGERLLPGTVLADRYCIESVLGAGAFGVVWRARHVHLQTDCAVKLFDPPPGADPQDTSARFLQEARVTARLKCPYVAQVFDYGVHEGMPFLVLELLQGSSLARHLQSLRAQGLQSTPEETARIIRHVAEALEVAHAARVVHRDLKPDNIFLVPEGDHHVAKVLDFGIAKWSTDTAPSMTSTHTVMGTAHYMSPEQFGGAKQVDHRADLWSLGVLAFECLTGQLPFPGETFIDVAFRVCKEGPLVASQIAEVPPLFDAWFARATALDREHRFDSALEQAEALERVCRETPFAEPARAQPSTGTQRAVATTLQTEVTDRAALHAETRQRRRWLSIGGAAVLGLSATWRVFSARPREAALPQLGESTASILQPASPAGRGPAPAPPPSAAPAAVGDGEGAAAPSAAQPGVQPLDDTSQAPTPAQALPHSEPRIATKSVRVVRTTSATPTPPVTPTEPTAAAAGLDLSLALEDAKATTFDREAAAQALDAAATQARNCRPPGGPTGTGRVEVSYEPSGRVVAVSMLTSRFENTQTASCVRMLFRRAKVPAFKATENVVVGKGFEIPTGDPTPVADSPRPAPQECEPPWTIDAKGIRRAKPACL